MNLYIREINKNDELELLKMYEEIINDTIEDKFEGFRILEKIKTIGYDELLKEIEKFKNIKPYRKDLVDQYTYVLVDDNNHIYGGISIRQELNDILLTFGGHIGYLIRPSERKKGYGTLMLSLALKECAKFGINKVLVTCREENIASAKVIENNGGIYENSKEHDNKMYRRYWINI